MAANPALKAAVDWNNNGTFGDANEDISARVVGEGRLLTITRSVDFMGGAGSPSDCRLSLDNSDNFFTRGSSSPVSANLHPGRQLRIEAIYNSITYPIFHGWIRRIVPIPGLPGRAEIIAEDALFRFSRRDSGVQLLSRSLSDFRAALLTGIGEPSNRRDLSLSGPESTFLPTGADQQDIQSVLGEINNGTGTIHFIRPKTVANNLWEYVTIDRLTMLVTPSVATYAADQIESWGQYDTNDEALINRQYVEAMPYVSSDGLELLWERRGSFNVAAGETRVIYARWSDPIRIGRGKRPADRIEFIGGQSGTVTRSINFYSTSAEITYLGGASGGTVTNPQLYGRPMQPEGLGAVRRQDSASIAAYGEWLGPEVTSSYIGSDDEAAGLASYRVFRYGTPRSKPVIPLKRNTFPDMFQREPGQRIIASNGKLGITNMNFLIEGLTLAMDAGGSWSLALSCEEVVATQSFFTIGGSAAQGVGGAAILGY